MSVMEWLLDSDSAIRWQVMRDLTHESPEAVAAERSKVAGEGWGARLLALQDEGGQWGRHVLPSEADGLSAVEVRQRLRLLQGLSTDDLAGYLGIESATVLAWENGQTELNDERFERYQGAVNWMRDSVGTYNPPWVSTTYTLLLLRHMGLDPAGDEARRAVALVRDNCRWDQGGQAYFDGEVEPCINGMVAALGAYFDESVDGIVERLLGEQLADGGWNCEAERGSIRSSFHTTISVLEGLLEYEQTREAAPRVTESRLTGQEYLLERRMLRRLSTGEMVDADFTRFSFPSRWHYDLLRGLDYLRAAGVNPDERCAEAIELVAAKCDSDGRWPLENTHEGLVHFEMEDGDGEPSRWNTLRAMRVLDWSGRAAFR